MNAFLLSASLFAALSVSHPYDATESAQPLRPEAPDLVQALRTADFAEIYVIGPHIEFPAAPRPEIVRSSGCSYRVRRSSPQWDDLERRLSRAEIRITPSDRRSAVRVGLVLSDRFGTIYEIYADDQVWPGGVVPGLAQRRQADISRSFVVALLDFVAQHPDLTSGELRPGSCPAR